MNKPKLVVILGPTASGKSDLAVEIAKKFDGEVISADSRQVYRGLNIGTGKITKEEMDGIPHHLLDVASPQDQFTVSEYKTLAEEAIRKVLKKHKLPIICGGTGFYIDALLGEKQIPEVEPNLKLREELETKSTEELFEMLKKLDPVRAENIDAKNPRRLVRAIEICYTLGPNSASRFAQASLGKKSKYDFLKIGIKTEDEKLKQKINKRLVSRIKSGMIEEAKKLHKKGLSYERMRELGLEYRFLADFLEGKITEKEMMAKLQTEIWRYAKRQKTWFKKDKDIVWIEPKISEAKKLVREFL